MDGDSNLLVLAVVAVVALVAFWLVDRHRYAFIVGIVRGEPRMRRGKATAAFLHQLTQLCREHQVQYGWVGGIQQVVRIRLAFSRSVPPALQQQLRNLWQQVGWGNRNPKMPQRRR
jgi:hypothetical protein